MSRRPDGLSARSQVANRLLALSGQVSDSASKETLRKLERLTLNGPNGGTETSSYQSLDIMLSDAAHVLGGGNPAQNKDYLDRLHQQLLAWQEGKDERKSSRMSIFDWFSKDKRERNRKDKLIEELRKKVFELEQRHGRLARDIIDLEKKRDEQVQLAVKEPPGTPLYNTAKGRHAVLSAQVKAKQFESRAVAKVMETNQTYLSSLVEERDMAGLSSYMPASIETMEMDLERSNERIREEIEKLRMSGDIMEDIRRDKDELYGSLADEGAVSDFDRAVANQAENQAVLDSFQQAVEQAAKKTELEQEQEEKSKNV
ncbi:MAG TPA: hypothetical protein PLO90_03700 [Clostridia bacterium]|nr:hypothetical protein [Clostridia bacterium]HPA60741.1 hypothetical protein [Clostridia bacterium]HPY43451.1 hypothetical protein [Clostridia bacterium]HQA97521.1 hypothetical protein [Clostridia bacterium]HQO55946.1 hypothetical protein [Clostridia bacterium]